MHVAELIGIGIGINVAIKHLTGTGRGP
jgi:hypothetical protein